MKPFAEDEVADLVRWAKAFPSHDRARDILRWAATVHQWKSNHKDAVEKKRRSEEIKQGIIDEIQRENEGLRERVGDLEKHLELAAGRLHDFDTLEADVKRLEDAPVTSTALTSWVFETKGLLRRLRLILKGITAS